MYVEKIRPGLYGVPLPWYFPFTKNFWRPNKSRVAGKSKLYCVIHNFNYHMFTTVKRAR